MYLDHHSVPHGVVHDHEPIAILRTGFHNSRSSRTDDQNEVVEKRPPVVAIKAKDGLQRTTSPRTVHWRASRTSNVCGLSATAVVGAGGDMSDFQYIQSLLDDLVVEEVHEPGRRSMNISVR
ncbi:hypothetical protein NEOLEDRAFT_1184854 [Neolentinus lepideus HHB14362 ss-1]|uniref:Uncharacterized protein n=1 Tax=Neolentinus lepideus HHB14362 ss-1 TaxID=1314782 RepID=A0A165LEF0_9AGAM|nr:hypothetical protein NEOLEDRAFT_1184854 [Neolentinus lepideus HHB14362 ss-1]